MNNDLTSCLMKRRKARTALRNYVVAHAEEIEIEFCVIIPENVKNISGINFGNWVMKNAHVFMTQRDNALFIEFLELVSDFICCENNVTIAESLEKSNKDGLLV